MTCAIRYKVLSFRHCRCVIYSSNGHVLVCGLQLMALYWDLPKLEATHAKVRTQRLDVIVRTRPSTSSVAQWPHVEGICCQLIQIAPLNHTCRSGEKTRCVDGRARVKQTTRPLSCFGHRRKTDCDWHISVTAHRMPRSSMRAEHCTSHICVSRGTIQYKNMLHYSLL